MLRYLRRLSCSTYLDSSTRALNVTGSFSDRTNKDFLFNQQFKALKDPTNREYIMFHSRAALFMVAVQCILIYVCLFRRALKEYCRALAARVEASFKQPLLRPRNPLTT